MKRQMFIATAFSAVLAVSAAAQTPPQTPPPTGERSQAQVTVTGCLAQAPSSATGATGTTGTATAGSEFILKNATMGTMGASPSTTAGTSGATASAMGKSFKLVGGSPSDLKDNVDTKVEIRGTIEKPSVTTPPATATATDKDVQTLRVTSVKKIADSCQ